MVVFILVFSWIALAVYVLITLPRLQGPREWNLHFFDVGSSWAWGKVVPSTCK